MELLSVTNFPRFWEGLFTGGEQPPDFVIYASIVLGIIGLAVVVGLWMVHRWSFWATIVVGVLNFVLGAPGLVMAPTATIKGVIAVAEILAIIMIVLVLRPESRRA